MTDRRALALGAAAVALACAALWAGGVPLRPLQPVVVAWALALVACWPRDRGALGVLAVSAAAHAATWSPRVILHFAKAYALLTEAAGTSDPDVRYGDAWPALMGLLTRALGGGVDAPHLADALLSVLVAPLVHDVVRRVAGPGAALVAGLAAALLPLSLALAPTETTLVAVATLQVAAVAGALRQDVRGDVLAATSLGLLAHARPEQLVTAVLGGALLAVLGRRAALGATAVLVGWRVLALLAAWDAVGGAAGLQPEQVAGLRPSSFWPDHDAVVVALDPTRTPLGLTALALVGAVAALRRPRARWLVAFALLSVLLYVSQPLVPDRLRFQLPSMAWVAALAGVGTAAVAARSRGLAAVGLLVAAASWWPARSPLQPPFVWQAEYATLRRVVGRVPPGAVVRYAATLDRDDGFGTWVRAHSPGRWRPLDGPERPGELRWVGAADRAPGATPPDTSGWTPVEVREVAPSWGGMLAGGDEPVEVGLWRVGARR